MHRQCTESNLVLQNYSISVEYPTHSGSTVSDSLRTLVNFIESSDLIVPMIPMIPIVRPHPGPVLRTVVVYQGIGTPSLNTHVAA